MSNYWVIVNTDTWEIDISSGLKATLIFNDKISADRACTSMQASERAKLNQYIVMEISDYVHLRDASFTEEFSTRSTSWWLENKKWVCKKYLNNQALDKKYRELLHSDNKADQYLFSYYLDREGNVFEVLLDYSYIGFEGIRIKQIVKVYGIS